MSKREPRQLSTSAPAGAPTMWRSISERLDPARSADEATMERGVQVEKSDLISLGRKASPTDASAPKSNVGRREFLAVSGAAAAAASFAGCIRRPVEHILPYSRQPEYALPGVALHYATSFGHRGDALGVIVESHEGRPTKIEGNPAHPASHPGRETDDDDVAHGGTDLLTQATILNLYDLDRSAHVQTRNDEGELANSSWSAFDEAFESMLEAHASGGGAGLRFLAPHATSPSFVSAKQTVLARFPEARFHTYASVHEGNVREGARLAFGQPATTLVDYKRARVIVSLDCDFLGTEPGSQRSAHLFADGRRLSSPSDPMNRLYVVEGQLSLTGSNADHRLRIATSDVERYARALAAALASPEVDLGAVRAALGETGEFAERWITAVAADLRQNRGRSAIVVGSRQPAHVHALAHAMNSALGNFGGTVSHHDVVDPSEGAPLESIASLAQDIQANRVRTLVILGGNPVYDAPADLGFEALLGTDGLTSVHLASHVDETSAHCTWHLPMAHPLECWGDHRSADGTYSVQQPLISPLRSGRSALEIVGLASGERSWRGYRAVRRTFRNLVGVDVFDRAWRAILQRGVATGVPGNQIAVEVDLAGVAAAVRAGATAATERGEGDWEVVFAPCPKVFDGSVANNHWLLELPDPISKLSWDNAAYLSWGSARELGVRNGDMVVVSREGTELELPAMIVPGTADRTLTLHLGWGRTRAGSYASGQGFDVQTLRTSSAFHFMGGVTVRASGGTYPIALTQEHHVMEGRPLAIDATLEQYQAQPDFAQWREPDGNVPPLWAEVDYTQPHQPAQGGQSWSLLPGNRTAPEDAPPRHAWGMVIDLTTCTGCSACTIACNAENNIPSVGKDQVARGREMHWMRLDRYFLEYPNGERRTEPHMPWESPDSQYEDIREDELEVAFQPVGCQHCEEAPCENVCPVNATAHSPEGLNEMAYNRCIGTRYCMNNCPYKVRRFNYLAYQGHVTELQRMQFNPNVSVRMRGVMEKCTYCVQRIQTARIASRNEGRPMRDGDVVTACQQACPSQAIAFGDLNDPEGRARRMARMDRHYRLIANVGTQPRTTFLGKIRNPNREMA